MKKILIILTLSLISTLIFSQNLPMNQYFTSFSTWNPGYVGSKESINFNFNYQQEQDMKSKNEFNFSFDLPISSKNMGVGVVATTNQFHNRNTNLSLIYAYQIKIKKGLKLGLGISGGFNRSSIENKKILVWDDGDESFTSESESWITPKAGFGMFLQNKNFYASLSVPDFWQEKVLISSGYKFYLDKNFNVKTLFLLDYNPSNNRLLTDVNTGIGYRNNLNLTIGYRTNNSISFMIDIKPTKSLKIGYSYQVLNIGNTHQIFINYEISKKKIKSNNFF